MTVLLRVPGLSWPAPTDAGAGAEPVGRCACYILAVLADDHTATAAAHHQLTGLLHAPADRLPPDALADQLAAIAHTAVTGHDHPHLHQLLDARGVDGQAWCRWGRGRATRSVSSTGCSGLGGAVGEGA